MGTKYMIFPKPSMVYNDTHVLLLTLDAIADATALAVGVSKANSFSQKDSISDSAIDFSTRSQTPIWERYG